jgi:hypothetical protein
MLLLRAIEANIDPLVFFLIAFSIIAVCAETLKGQRPVWRILPDPAL